MKEIVIATRNPGKLEEFKVLMKDLEVELRSLEEWPNVPEPEETGKTFMANARLKAVYYAKETGLPCIADDSGLEVLALEGLQVCAVRVMPARKLRTKKTTNCCCRR